MRLNTFIPFQRTHRTTMALTEYKSYVVDHYVEAVEVVTPVNRDTHQTATFDLMCGLQLCKAKGSKEKSTYEWTMNCPKCNRTFQYQFDGGNVMQRIALRNERLRHEALIGALKDLKDCLKPTIDLKDFIDAFAEEKKASLLEDSK